MKKKIRTLAEGVFTVCNSTHYYYYTSGCVKQCPDDKPYAFDLNCTTSCPSDRQLQDDFKNCYSHCSYFCQIFCLDNESPSVCQSHCGAKYYISNGICKTPCPDGQYLYNKKCISYCENPLYNLVSQKTCGSKCDDIDKYFYTINNTLYCNVNCPTNYFLIESNLTCVSQCPSGYYAYKNKCVTSCPANTYLSNYVCQDYCKNKQNYISENCYCNTSNNFEIYQTYYCVTKCKDYEIRNSTLDCITCSSLGMYLYNGACITSCPTGTVALTEYYNLCITFVYDSNTFGQRRKFYVYNTSSTTTAFIVYAGNKDYMPDLYFGSVTTEYNYLATALSDQTGYNLELPNYAIYGLQYQIKYTTNKSNIENMYVYFTNDFTNIANLPEQCNFLPQHNSSFEYNMTIKDPYKTYNVSANDFVCYLNQGTNSISLSRTDTVFKSGNSIRNGIYTLNIYEQLDRSSTVGSKSLYFTYMTEGAGSTINKFKVSSLICNLSNIYFVQNTTVNVSLDGTICNYTNQALYCNLTGKGVSPGEYNISYKNQIVYGGFISNDTPTFKVGKYNIKDKTITWELASDDFDLKQAKYLTFYEQDSNSTFNYSVNTQFSYNEDTRNITFDLNYLSEYSSFTLLYVYSNDADNTLVKYDANLLLKYYCPVPLVSYSNSSGSYCVTCDVISTTNNKYDYYQHSLGKEESSVLCVSACSRSQVLNESQSSSDTNYVNKPICYQICNTGNTNNPYLYRIGVCVEVCNRGYYQTNYTNQCVQCPSGYKTYNGQCVSSCPSNALFIQESECQSQCYLPYYGYDYECVEKCNSTKPYILQDTSYTNFSRCVTECPSNYKIEENLCTVNCSSSNPYEYNNYCYSSCPTGTYLYNYICYDKCPEGTYGYNAQCVSDCPNYSDEDDNLCIDSCPSGKYIYSNQKKCVSSCPTGTIINSKTNECIEYCKANANTKSNNCYCDTASGNFYLEDSICLQSCPDYQARNSNKECIYCLEFTPQRYALNGLCVYECGTYIPLNDLNCTINNITSSNVILPRRYFTHDYANSSMITYNGTQYDFNTTTSSHPPTFYIQHIDYPERYHTVEANTTFYMSNDTNDTDGTGIYKLKYTLYNSTYKIDNLDIRVYSQKTFTDYLSNYFFINSCLRIDNSSYISFTFKSQYNNTDLDRIKASITNINTSQTYIFTRTNLKFQCSQSINEGYYNVSVYENDLLLYTQNVTFTDVNIESQINSTNFQLSMICQLENLTFTQISGPYSYELSESNNCTYNNPILDCNLCKSYYYYFGNYTITQYSENVITDFLTKCNDTSFKIEKVDDSSLSSDLILWKLTSDNYNLQYTDILYFTNHSDGSNYTMPSSLFESIGNNYVTFKLYYKDTSFSYTLNAINGSNYTFYQNLGFKLDYLCDVPFVLKTTVESSICSTCQETYGEQKKYYLYSNKSCANNCNGLEIVTISEYNTYICFEYCDTDKKYYLKTSDTSECVGECPKGYYLNIYNATCVKCPNGYYSYNNECVERCPSDVNYIYYNACVSSCPSGTYIYKTYYCVDTCPDDMPYFYEGVCYSSCPYLIQNNECVAQCDSGYFLLDGIICNKTCNEPFFKLEASPNNKCVSVCPSEKKYINQSRYCVANCGNDYINITDNFCVNHCPYSTKIVINSVKYCYPQCPSNYPYYHKYNNTCLSSCPDNYYIFEYNMTCYNPCLNLAPIINSGYCVIDCYDRKYGKYILRTNSNGAQECFEHCEETKYELDYTCVNSCPEKYENQDCFIGYFKGLPNLKKCYKDCPEHIPYHNVDNLTCMQNCTEGQYKYLANVTQNFQKYFCLSSCSKYGLNESTTENYVCDTSYIIPTHDWNSTNTTNSSIVYPNITKDSCDNINDGKTETGTTIQFDSDSNQSFSSYCYNGGQYNSEENKCNCDSNYYGQTCSYNQNNIYCAFESINNITNFSFDNNEEQKLKFNTLASSISILMQLSSEESNTELYNYYYKNLSSNLDYIINLLDYSLNENINFFDKSNRTKAIVAIEYVSYITYSKSSSRLRILDSTQNLIQNIVKKVIRGISSTGNIEFVSNLGLVKQFCMIANDTNITSSFVNFYQSNESLTDNAYCILVYSNQLEEFLPEAKNYGLHSDFIKVLSISSSTNRLRNLEENNTNYRIEIKSSDLIKNDSYKDMLKYGVNVYNIDQNHPFFNDKCYINRLSDVDIYYDKRYESYPNTIHSNIPERCQILHFTNDANYVNFECNYSSINELENTTLYYYLSNAEKSKKVEKSFLNQCVGKKKEIGKNIAFYLYFFLMLILIAIVIALAFLTNSFQWFWDKGNPTIYKRDCPNIAQLIFEAKNQISESTSSSDKKDDQPLEKKTIQNNTYSTDLISIIKTNFLELYPVSSLFHPPQIIPLELWVSLLFFNIFSLFGFNGVLYTEKKIDKRSLHSLRDNFGYPMRCEFDKIFVSMLLMCLLNLLIRLIVLVNYDDRKAFNVSVLGMTTWEVKAKMFASKKMINCIISFCIILGMTLFFAIYCITFCGIYIHTQYSWFYSGLWTIFIIMFMFSPFYIIIVSLIEYYIIPWPQTIYYIKQLNPF